MHPMNGVKVHSGVGKLRCLQSMRRLKVESDAIGELGNLIELKRLEIFQLRKEDGNNLCISLEKMRHLKHLEVTAKEEDEEIDMHSLLHPPQSLQQLILCGNLNKLPHWIPTLQNLLDLRLRWSRLRDDPLQALGSLPNLVQLRLGNAYDGEKLCVKEGQYPRLKELWLDELRGLKQVTVENRAMLILEVLLIRCCKLLVEVPQWLKCLISIRKLFLTDMPMAFLESFQSDDGAKRVDFIKHISLVRHYDSRSRSTQEF